MHQHKGILAMVLLLSGVFLLSERTGAQGWEHASIQKGIAAQYPGDKTVVLCLF